MQVDLALKALSINFVHILGPRWAGSEPAVRGHDLQPANGSVVPGGGREHAGNFLARQLRGRDLLRRELCHEVLMLRRRWRIEALIDRLAELTGELLIKLSRVAPQHRRHLRRQKAHNHPILASGPYSPVSP